MSKDKLSETVDALVGGFMHHDAAAFGTVYDLTHGLLARRASKAGLEWDDAEDCASDAILYVQGWDRQPDSLLAALRFALDIMVKRAHRDAGRTVTYGATEEGDDDFMFTDDLEGVEEYKLSQGGELHEYLTSIETTTPEDETLAENLREFLERKAIEACGAEAWAIYHAVVIQEKKQAEVAETHDLSQQRVSQLVREVGLALKAALTAAA